MPTLCFGGSFNPIHNGHLRCAEAVAERAGYDRVLLIPSAQPPHKHDTADLAPAVDRLAMCRLAMEGSAQFEVSDRETRRPGPSYTIDTVKELQQMGFKRIDWLIGSDMVMFLPKWHRPADLLREVNFIVMARPGWKLDWEALPPEFRHLRENVVGVPQIDIRATDIRSRVRQGLPINHLVPPSVAGYIDNHSLYRD